MTTCRFVRLKWQQKWILELKIYGVSLYLRFSNNLFSDFISNISIGVLFLGGPIMIGFLPRITTSSILSSLTRLSTAAVHVSFCSTTSKLVRSNKEDAKAPAPSPNNCLKRNSGKENARRIIANNADAKAKEVSSLRSNESSMESWRLQCH